MAGPMKYWIEKANPVDLKTDDFTGGTDGGYLSNAQAKEFLKVAIASSVLLNMCRNEFSDAPKFEIPRIAFGSRVLKVGTESTRLDESVRVKPTTGLCTLSTYLFRGEIRISDETFEDQIEREGLADTIATQAAEAVGRDIEEYGLLNNLTRATPADDGGGYDAALDVFDGLVKQLVGLSDAATTGMVVPAAQNIADGSVYSAFDALFATMIEKLPSQYRRNPSALRFFTSYKLRDRFRASLDKRGTPLGDKALTDELGLTFHGIPVVGIPMLTGTYTINTAAMIYDNVAFLCDPSFIAWGFHRKVKFEWFRDPREGARSLIPTVRFDVQITDPNAIVSVKKLSNL